MRRKEEGKAGIMKGRKVEKEYQIVKRNEEGKANIMKGREVERLAF